MSKYLFLAALFFLTDLSTVFSQQKHFISDKQYLESTNKVFNETYRSFSKYLKLNFEKRTGLSNEEKEALIFLYAYMPLSDWADYSEEFYIDNVKASFLARNELKWVRNIPEQIYRHFVLPIRVNNENLDTSRIVFYKELKKRVENLSMYEAALEVNHWCHEKVTYRGSDARTSSPLCTMKKAIGRCGEESTFTVAAMRAVGIPARQCYTPRWAHSDDNHAWVEVWVDGKWYFLGACEPEPELNLGWFAAPVKRAMMVNTTVFGDYSGSEEILNKGTKFTKINLLANYAPVKTIFIKTTNNKNVPLKDITVEFQLYNYAEFYPIAIKKTNIDGIASLTTGFGDLLIWVYDNKGFFNFKKISVENSDTVSLVIDNKNIFDTVYNFDIIPPIVRSIDVNVSESQREINNERLKYEDSIRKNYENSFIDTNSSKAIALKYNYPIEKTVDFLQKSRGNWREIKEYLEEVPQKYRELAVLLLDAIAEKDLHDVTKDVLFDHLYNSVFDANFDTLFNINYIFNPRVEYEMIKPYKNEMNNFFKKYNISDANGLIKWIKKNIKLNNVDNYSRAPISPVGCLKIRTCDSRSRDIFFVSACRSIGIASRLEPSTKTPQYYSWKGWTDVNFERKIKEKSTPKTELIIENSEHNLKIKPEYSTHFTIQKYNKGRYFTLDYEMDKRWDNFPVALTVDNGKYLVVTGNRLPDGSVLVSLNFFKTEPDKKRSVKIELRQNRSPFKVLGNLSMDSYLRYYDTGIRETLGKISENKPCVLFWLEPGKEPTRHILVDIEKLKSNFEKWEGKIVIVIPDKFKARYDENIKQFFPEKALLTVDNEDILNKCLKTINRNNIDFPVVIYSNEKGEILFISEGYRIGIGEQLLKIF
jgi:hypothetical protein